MTIDKLLKVKKITLNLIEEVKTQNLELPNRVLKQIEQKHGDVLSALYYELEVVNKLITKAKTK